MAWQDLITEEDMIREEESVEIPDFGSGYTMLMCRRAWLIEALRSENFDKAVDTLYDSDTGRFCLIGVGCYIMGASIDSLIHDSDERYPEFEENFRVSPKTRQYLVSMNDGTAFRWPQSDGFGSTYTGSRLIRPENKSRTFLEIASFLENLWGF